MCSRAQGSRRACEYERHRDTYRSYGEVASISSFLAASEDTDVVVAVDGGGHGAGGGGGVGVGHHGSGVLGLVSVQSSHAVIELLRTENY